MTDRARRAGRPAGADAEATKQRIRAVAVDHFGRFGYGSAAIKGIANDAGVTSGSVHYHFESKQRLLEDVAAWLVEPVARRLSAAASEPEGLGAQVAALLDELVAVCAESPDYARFTLVLIGDAARDPALRAAYEDTNRAYRAVYGNLIDDAVARGELATTIDRAAVVDVLDAIAAGILSLIAMRPGVAMPPGYLRCARLLVAGELFAA